jgi:anti-sigma regulatory factor (Ser/Thr protein kinase)
MPVDSPTDGSDAPHLEHPALLYDDERGFLDYMVPYVTRGIDAGEPVFVAVGAAPLTALRAEFGTRVPGLTLVDTRTWHPNPSTRLRAFHEYVAGELRDGATAIRLAGEPVWPSDDPDLEREWQRYESVLNEVLEPFPVTLVCTYDTSAIDPSVAAVARRTHPFVSDAGAVAASPDFEDPERFLRHWNAELSPPPSDASSLADPTDLTAARRFLLEHAMRAGLGRDRTADLCVAANEIVTNALVHGGGPVSLTTWVEGATVVCQIEDEGGGIEDPVASYRPPSTSAEMGRGLWLARQLVDLIQFAPGAISGTTVRLRIGRR